MMTQEELISALIGKTIGLYPTEVALLLTKNGVVIDADTFDIDQLISATFSGVNTNKSFKKDLIDFIDSKNVTITNTEPDSYSNLTGTDYANMGTSLLGAVGGFLGGKQQQDIAKANANATIQANQTALEIAKLNQQTALAQLQAKNQPSSSNNLPLYIGLGVGGVVIIGLVVYFVTKK
jgi:metal-dependent amidase/aminoacylase/carboxypeptidase family protein